MPLRSFLRALAGLALAAVLGAAPAAAQDSLRTAPGYVDLSDAEGWFDRPAHLDINLDGPLLTLVARSSEDDDPEFARLVRSLRSIRVRGFPMEDVDVARVLAYTEALARRLEAQGWRRAIHIRRGEDEHTDTVNVYVLQDGEHIAGLTVLINDPSEQSLFVNIVGTLTPDQISTLGRGLDLDGVESVRLGGLR
jgi:hypothetical protein